MEEIAVKTNYNLVNGNGVNGTVTLAPQLCKGPRRCCRYEEDGDDIRLSSLNSILHTGVSDYQDIALLDTKPLGKVLVIDGKLQSAERNEFIYHESLVHPALVHHSKLANETHVYTAETARYTYGHGTDHKLDI